MEWRAWVFKRVIHVTNTAHRAPYEILQQHNCRAHAMKRQHSSNFLSLHSLVVPIPLHCTLKCILIHFLQPHLLHFKKNKKTHTTTNPTYAHRKRKVLHQFSYSTISYPSSNPQMTATKLFATALPTRGEPPSPRLQRKEGDGRAPLT